MTNAKQITKCYHCGEDCIDEKIEYKSHPFCCVGCKTVFSLLEETGLSTYYAIEQSPGSTKNKPEADLAYLDLKEVSEKLIEFSEGNLNRVTFYLPSIHCSACIWLLEKLNKLNSGIHRSEVNYLRKELTVVFDAEKLSLRGLVELLESLGYTPDLQRNAAQSNERKIDKQLLLKLGVAGFVFGNVMLFSFPEYLSIDEETLHGFSDLFGWLNLLLSIPVLVYSSTDYLLGAWRSLKVRYLTIDVPIALGILTLFIRSAFEVLSGYGPGYFDSFAGLVFFLLVGKWFQSRTYSALAFDRDFKSYFPVAVSRITTGEDEVCMLDDVTIGDRLRIRNNQIIPADSILKSETAEIDYSFVSGESDRVLKSKGDFLYAGGRQVAGEIEIEVRKDVAQGYLTSLWSQVNVAKKEPTNPMSSIINKTSQWFSIGILIISLLTLAYWAIVDPSEALNAFTAVLIIACPCALALAMPFANGNVSRILGKRGFFLRNAATLETLSRVTAFVFDKTGTLSDNRSSKVIYEGSALTFAEREAVASVVSSSVHPVSRAIAKYLDVPTGHLLEFKETAGQGIEGLSNNYSVKLGSPKFCGIDDQARQVKATVLLINGTLKGSFKLKKSLRQGIADMVYKLRESYRVELLSGDNDTEREAMRAIFGSDQSMRFNQSPQDKFNFVDVLESDGTSCAMFGDGLNDAGALSRSSVGIAVADDVFSFSPSCDVIMQADRLNDFESILAYVKRSINVVRVSIVISLIYNVIGLFFAVQAELTPLVAAILMPLSSISVVVFVSSFTTAIAPKLN